MAIAVKAQSINVLNVVVHWKLVRSGGMEESGMREGAEKAEALFNMQHGPAIPWSLAELIYEAYSALYGTSQSLQRLHERGGFGWAEVEYIFKECKKRKPDKYASIKAKHKVSL